jgi:serine/threonine protein kinase
MVAPNTILFGRYRIIHELGHGGMGAVYQAMDEELSCLVAVKETFATNDEQRRAFHREAKLLANLDHPALPRVTQTLCLAVSIALLIASSALGTKSSAESGSQLSTSI